MQSSEAELVQLSDLKAHGSVRQAKVNPKPKGNSPTQADKSKTDLINRQKGLIRLVTGFRKKQEPEAHES